MFPKENNHHGLVIINVTINFIYIQEKNIEKGAFNQGIRTLNHGIKGVSSNGQVKSSGIGTGCFGTAF